MNDNWDDLRYFLALAREGSVSGAARQLGVQHTTVARRIQSLEKHYAIRLFDRTSHGYSLSADAHTLVAKAEAAEAAILQVQRSLQATDRRLAGAIRLTLPGGLYEPILAEDIADFCRHYPDIELELQVTKGLMNLAGREADIAVRFTATPPESLVGREIFKLRHGIYCSKTLTERCPSDIPLVLWGSDIELPAWAREYFPEARVGLRVDTLPSMYAAVAAGMGVARMPCYYPNSRNAAQVMLLPYELPRSGWGLWVLNHIDLRRTPRVQVLKNYLINVLEKKRPLFTEPSLLLS